MRVIEISTAAIFCTSILWKTYSESNFIQDYYNMLVQNMPNLAVIMVVAREKIERKNQILKIS